jgi:hypothetical protein
VGETVEVRVRITSFGSTGAPASVDVLIRGETLPATNTLLVEFVPTFDTQVVSLLASKDTSIFQRSVGASNGAGELLSVGTVFEGTFFPKVYESRSLLAFDLLVPIPQTATIDGVEMRFDVVSLTGTGDWVGIHRVAPDIASPPVIWEEGDADVAGGRGAEISSVPAANWKYRESPNRLWAIAGGDPMGSLSTPLDQLKITKAGVTAIFESSALTTAVADMVVSAEDREGFLLAEVAGSMTGNTDRAVQFASRDEQISGVFQPEMIVTFTPTVPYQEGTVQTGAVSFVGEGEDFRWIYDLDFDDILVTDIGGICTVLVHNESQGNYLPYSYQFTGDPGYVGLDCCTWNIEAPQTGTVGTGQALFFHNLSASDPNNLPPDTDGDGIHDNCDNCIDTPNGPLLGTCLTGPSAGSQCHSDLECAGGGCGMSQQDADGDFEGDACEVPEPGFGLMLALGSLALMVGKKFKQPLRQQVASRSAIPFSMPDARTSMSGALS